MDNSMDNPESQTHIERMKLVAKKAALPVAFVTTSAVFGYLGWKAHDKAFQSVFDLMASHVQQHEEFANKAQAFIDTKGLYSEFQNFLDRTNG